MNELPAAPEWDESDALSQGGAAPCHDGTELDLVRRSGLFDPAHYAAQLSGPPCAPDRLLQDFMAGGWRARRRPNAYFDTGWYLSQNPDVAGSGQNPLLHYLREGEARGCAPAPYFDVLWYRGRHDIPPRGTALRHFLERRLDGAVSPIAEFDPEHYLRASPDVAAAGVDPFEHYLLYGYREGRDPSAEFDTRFYMRRYMGNEAHLNPLMHYRQFRRVMFLHTRRPAQEISVLDEVHRFTRPGPEFEARAPLPRSAVRRAKVLAYYLPQYHAIPENDAWWGEGFTEWNSVARGMPRFAGHYQPRIPRDLGHYTLDAPETMRRQIAFAQEAGLFGFVQYFYWFNGRRLLERPLDAFLADATLDFPFCLMWTNENWTRRWDGSDAEVLISQDYREADDAALVDTLARHFADPRYIRLGGRPALMVYRPALIPDTANTVARWRALFLARHNEAPLLVMAQSFDAADPRAFGFDAAIEFPPHKLVGGLPLDDTDLAFMDGPGRMQVFSYQAVVAASLAEPPPPYPLIKTAVPGWDNDARRQGNGLMLRGATPRAYEDWMTALVARAAANPVFGEALACVNAWNEWAEGAYLEPDVHYGSAFLNATARAVAGLGGGLATKLLLVGHDAFPAGAQHLLWHLGRQFRQGGGLEIEFLLLGDGALKSDYAKLAPTHVVGVADLAGRLAALGARGFRAAIVNTAAAAAAVPSLRAAGISCVLLVHEMPGLLAERKLLPDLARALPHCARVIFAAPAVRDAVATLAKLDPAACAILPQGIYRPAPFDADARRRTRLRLGVPGDAPLALGIGYGDLRKGFDLFLQAWRAHRAAGGGGVFCWIGELDPTMRAYLGAGIAAAEATGTFHLAGYRDDVADWLSGGDVLLLPSREDAFPSVALEAMSAGLRVVAFEGGGGICDLVRERDLGAVVAMEDAGAMARAIPAAAIPDRARVAAVAAGFGFGRYAAELSRLALPDAPVISAAVISYNHAGHLGQRLASVFAQGFPVREVLLLDDASTDGSLAVARATAEDWRRDLTILAAAKNSGRAAGQWRRAAEAAQGEFLWLAEGDDAAEPAMLGRLAAMLAASPGIDLAFCDSRAIDAAGDTLFPSHLAYYAECGATALGRTTLFEARDFARRFLAERNLLVNVSAVLWRRATLLAALDRCGAELAGWRLASDWRLYVEVLAESDGCVAYVAEPLNMHRRHEAGVTAATTARRHLAEIGRMHRLTRERLGLDEAARARQAAYVVELRGRLR